MPSVRWARYYFFAVGLVFSAVLNGKLAMAAAKEPVVSAHDIATHRLENGTRVVVVADPHAELVAVQAWLGAGSADEPEARAGLAHAVEHMLFKGSAHFPVGQLTQRVAQAGGQLNAWTSFDHMVMHAVAPRDALPIVMHGIGDALQQPVFDAEEFAREREVILEEQRQSARDPARVASNAMFAAAFAQHPYRRPVIGVAHTVANLGVRDVVDYYRQHYVGANLTLVVAGGVELGHVAQLVAQHVAGLPAGRPVGSRAVEPPQHGLRVNVQHAAVDQAYLSIGFRAPAVRHPDFAALDVAALILGQRERSRLAVRLRDAFGTASAFAQVHATRDPGLLAIAAQSDVGHAPRVLAAVFDEIRALIAGPSATELHAAQVAIEVNRVRQLETVFGQARTVGWDLTTGGDAMFHFAYLDRVRRLTASQIGAAAQRYLQATQASVAAVMPSPGARTAAQWQRVVTSFASPPAATRGGKAGGSRGARTSPQAGATSSATARAERRVQIGRVTLLLRHESSVPVVAMRVVWRGGVRGESARDNGANAVLARWLTAGCGTLTEPQLRERLEQIGGSIVGVAGRNSLSLAAEFMTQSWAEGLALLSQCSAQPRWDRLAFREIVRTLAHEALTASQQPEQVAYQNFAKALFGDHPYSLLVGGTAQSLDKLTLKTVRAVWHAQYAEAPLTLALVGDFDADLAIAAVQQAFGGQVQVTPARSGGSVAQALAPPRRRPASATAAPLVAGAAPAPVVGAPATIAGPREFYADTDREGAHVVIGFAGTRVDAPDRFAVEAMTAALAGQAGRLFAALREREGLVYRVAAHSIEGLEPGFLAISTACQPERVDAVIAQVRAELAKLASEDFNQAELARIKQQLIGMQAMHLQRRSAIAATMAFHEAYGLGWTTWQAYAAAITALTVEDVRAAAASYLAWDRAVISVVRPPAFTPGAARRSGALRVPAGRAQPARRAGPAPRGKGRVLPARTARGR